MLRVWTFLLLLWMLNIHQILYIVCNLLLMSSTWVPYSTTALALFFFNSNISLSYLVGAFHGDFHYSSHWFLKHKPIYPHHYFVIHTLPAWNQSTPLLLFNIAWWLCTSHCCCTVGDDMHTISLTFVLETPHSQCKYEEDIISAGIPTTAYD